MAVTIKRTCLGRVGDGEGGAYEDVGVIHYGAGDADAEVPVNGYYVLAFEAQFMSVPDAATLVYMNETVVGDYDGWLVPSSGTMTVTRTVTTSALDMSYRIRYR